VAMDLSEDTRKAITEDYSDNEVFLGRFINGHYSDCEDGVSCAELGELDATALDDVRRHTACLEECMRRMAVPAEKLARASELVARLDALVAGAPSKARDNAVEELLVALEGPFSQHTVDAMAAFRRAHEELIGNNPPLMQLGRLRVQALTLEDGYRRSARELLTEYTKTYATYHNGTHPSYIEHMLARVRTLRERVENDPTLHGLLAEAQGFEVLVATRPKPEGDALTGAHEALLAAITGGKEVRAQLEAGHPKRLTKAQKVRVACVDLELERTARVFHELGGRDYDNEVRVRVLREEFAKYLSKKPKG